MIEFIFFDVGGVLMHDFTEQERWRCFQSSLGLKKQYFDQFDKLWLQLTENGLTGFDIDLIRPELVKSFDLQLTQEHSLLDGLVQQFSRNQAIEPIVKYAACNVSIGLLTNMYPRMLKSIFANNIIEKEDKWDVIIDSSEVFLAKPNEKIFEMAESICSKRGEKILFVDNIEDNLIVPKRMGWRTFHYDINSSSNLRKLDEILKLVL